MKYHLTHCVIFIVKTLPQESSLVGAWTVGIEVFDNCWAVFVVLILYVILTVHYFIEEQMCFTESVPSDKNINWN